ncbi:glycine reductase [Treponema pedis]
MKKVICYINQFFGQIGGEEKAGIAPEYREGAVGSASGLNEKLKPEAEVIGTIICGDNYFNENTKEVSVFIENILKTKKADLIIAGPAFNAGRYGMACAGVIELVSKKGIPSLTAMYPENPGVNQIKGTALIIETSDTAAGMRKAIPKLASLAKKILQNEKIGKPSEEGYIPQGKRTTVLVEKRGSQRAVEMLLKRINGEKFETELPMPKFDSVEPAPAIKDLSKAYIALVTTGGIVPNGNPDRLQSASAQIWIKHDISPLETLKGKYETIHGGYDPVYANELPDRVVPLDILSEMKKKGEIAGIYKYFYSTTGTGTSVGNSVKFGKEIGKELSDAGVDGVIMTST